MLYFKDRFGSKEKDTNLQTIKEKFSKQDITTLFNQTRKLKDCDEDTYSLFEDRILKHDKMELDENHSSNLFIDQIKSVCSYEQANLVGYNVGSSCNSVFRAQVKALQFKDSIEDVNWVTNNGQVAALRHNTLNENQIPQETIEKITNPSQVLAIENGISMDDALSIDDFSTYRLEKYLSYGYNSYMHHAQIRAMKDFGLQVQDAIKIKEDWELEVLKKNDVIKESVYTHGAITSYDEQKNEIFNTVQNLQDKGISFYTGRALEKGLIDLEAATQLTWIQAEAILHGVSLEDALLIQEDAYLNIPKLEFSAVGKECAKIEDLTSPTNYIPATSSENTHCWHSMPDFHGYIESLKTQNALAEIEIAEHGVV